MNLKLLKPFNSANRGTVLVNKKFKKEKELKSKTKGLIKTSGRNNIGKITIQHKGNGNKKLYRQLESNKKKTYEARLVENIEYDPNRSAFLIRLFSKKTKTHSYAIAPAQIKIGQIYNNNQEIKLGNRLILEKIPIGTKIHAIGTKYRKKKSILQRSAGTFAQIIQKTKNLCLIRLSSGKLKEIINKAYATIGTISNPNHKYKIIGKAGKKRWFGIRPTVRGVAKNPIDHPHGGGEGRTSGGRPSVTPWAKPAHGKKTSKKK